jgi:hypothetical protein
MPAIPLDVGDAIGLAEFLQLLSDWLEADHDNLTASLAGSSDDAQPRDLPSGGHAELPSGGQRDYLV